jgi:hypothetical protein
MQFLIEFSEYFGKVVVGDRKNGTLAPFQKGFLICIKSLIGLFLDLSDAPIHCKYILTSHLNQDFVESSFANIRGIGRFNLNPNAVEMKSRVRRLVIGWNFCSGKNTAITQTEESLEFVTASKVKALTRQRSSSVPEFMMETEEVEVAWADIDPDVNVQSEELEFKTAAELCLDGGREYFAGFLAKKLHEKFPELASNSSMAGLWIPYISNGRLTQPSDWWLACVKKFDEYFCALHPTEIGIDRNPFVVERLVRRLATEFSTVPKCVIQYYSKIRTFIRIKMLNKQQEDAKYKKKEANRQLRKEEQSMLTEYQFRDQERDLPSYGQELMDSYAGEQLDELLTLLSLNEQQ